MSRFISLPKAHQLPRLPHPLNSPIDGRLHQPFFPPRSAIPTAQSPSYAAGNLTPSCILASHARQYVLARTEGDEEGERDEPDADAEVGRYFREGRHVRFIVDGGGWAPAVRVAVR